MAIVSPGVHTDLEVNLKPNLDTEQGLSHTVTHEVDLEVPPHLTDQEATLEAEAGAGIAEAEPAAGAVPMEVSIATGHPAGAGPGAAPMTPTAAPGKCCWEAPECWVGIGLCCCRLIAGPQA